MAAKRKKRGQRRDRGRFGFLYKILSAVLILAAIVVGSIVFFKVNTILVTGASQYSAQEIIDVSGVRPGDNLFRINKYRVFNAVLTKLPYVDDISLHRKLPDTLILSVTECVPVCAVQCGEEWWLLDAKCKLLERGDATLAEGRGKLLGIAPLTPTVGTPLSVGDAGKQKRASLSALLSALAERGLADKLDFIDFTAENVIRFGYAGRLTVELPMIADFKTLVYYFSRTLETMEASGDGETGGTLSFLYEDGAHLFPQRWMPPETPVTPAEGAEAAPVPAEETEAAPAVSTAPVQNGG